MNVLALIALGAGLFATTNIDDMFLLIAWFADRRPSKAQVVAGQYVGISVIVGASALAAFSAAAVAGGWVRFLGLVPIAIGLWRLVAIVRRWPGTNDEKKSTPASGVFAVASLTVSNGADNLGVYTPVFATGSPSELAAIVAVFAVMTGLWCLGAYTLVNHPQIGAPFRRYGHLLVPFVLIGIGISILAVH